MASEGVFDVVPVEDVRRYETELHEYLRANAAQVYEQVDGGAALSDESKEALLQANDQFVKSFQTTDGTPVINEPEVDALDGGEVKKSQLTVSRKTVKK